MIAQIARHTERHICPSFPAEESCLSTPVVWNMELVTARHLPCISRRLQGVCSAAKAKGDLCPRRSYESGCNVSHRLLVGEAALRLQSGYQRRVLPVYQFCVGTSVRRQCSSRGRLGARAGVVASGFLYVYHKRSDHSTILQTLQGVSCS